MKKILLLAATAIFTLAGAQAQVLSGPQKALLSKSSVNFDATVSLTPAQPKSLKKQLTPMKDMSLGMNRASREGETTDYSKIMTYMSWTNEDNYAPDLTKLLQGFNAGTYGFFTLYDEKLINLFAGNELGTINVYIGPGTESISILVIDPYTGETLWNKGLGLVKGGTEGITQSVACDYVLQKDQPILVGYQATYTDGTVKPGIAPTSMSATGWLIYLPGQGFANMYNIFGPYTLLMECETFGDAGLKANDISVDYIYPKRLKSGKDYSAKAVITNWGTNPISTLDMVYNDGTNEVALPLSAGDNSGLYYGSSVEIPIDGAHAGTTTGNVAVSLSSVNVNGEPDGDAYDNTIDGEMFVVKNSAMRQVVMEEFTGEWCGWCPRGIVGMEKAKAAYPKNVTVISVHDGETNPSSSYYDEYTDASYSDFCYNYVSGAPSAFLNRYTFTAYDPYYGSGNGIVADIEEMLSTGSEFAMGVASDLGDDNKLTVTAAIQPTMTVDAKNYLINFVITEDGLKGRQANYYSSSVQTDITADQIPADFIEYFNASNPMEVTYNDVSRYSVSATAGIEGSTDNLSFIEGKMVTYQYTIDMPQGVNPDSVHVIAMIIDQKTGEIVTAQDARLGDEAFAVGIESVKANDNATINIENGAINVAGEGKAYIYTVDGKLVNNITVNGNASIPTFGLKGVYVINVVSNGSVTAKKVVF